MTREEFLQKHELTEKDYKNLLRFETARTSSAYNMHEYIEMMKKYNANGGVKLAGWILEGNNYEEFLQVEASR